MPDLTIEASDHPLHRAQYIYVETHAWWLGSFGRHNHLTEHRLRQWVPADPEREWLLDRELTGRQTWLTGSAEEALDDGFNPGDIGPTGRFRALHGAFDTATDDTIGDAEEFCARPTRPRKGSWQSPTAPFLAQLPIDPDVLRTKLCAENPGSWFGPFAAAVTALRTCLVPAAVRGALYRALAGLPAVTVAEKIPNIDGHTCTALIHDAGRTRTELLIDPGNGQFAGERDTLRTDSRCGLGAGTVISTTAVATAVVDVPGSRPNGLAQR
ncbi:hypothetical protein [Pseudonocardia sp. GCM10023141]|uniref:hypothetical protein n=1 Tax=Pseudonocardia sp. GCM10023141 TaxID=3252653 RepID=UPI0036096DFA